MRFNDVILAAASFAVISTILNFVFGIALIPMNTYWGIYAVPILSVLISSLIVGCVFAGKIRTESRVTVIGKIAVLTAAFMSLAAVAGYGAIGHYSAATDEYIRNTYSTGSWTDRDWFSYEMIGLYLDATEIVVCALVFGFIGLYVGSMRKPSVKT